MHLFEIEFSATGCITWLDYQFTTMGEGIHKRQSLYKVSAHKNNKTNMKKQLQNYIHSYKLHYPQDKSKHNDKIQKGASPKLILLHLTS